MELTRPFKSNGMAKSTPFKATKLRAASKSEMFSGKASETATAASNDGVERQLPISCAKEIQGIAVDVGSLQHRPCPQYTGEVTGLFQPSLQLPSLNEALHRTIPSRYFSDTIFSETRTPSPLAPYSCFCSSTAECDSSRESDEGEERMQHLVLVLNLVMDVKANFTLQKRGKATDYLNTCEQYKFVSIFMSVYRIKRCKACHHPKEATTLPLLEQ
ncbi:hypothetical protein PsorP6_010735 [Peronosclerospora sorghi]|uniref:Uncharacterized protein n=1 Tax=Peronosclerospora sorghi TaxID=230839 RepID=A0ACC0VXU4_9STRA|nr:hypothetical protein PsorP6_010735 [Peronosclerospora sorghi]